MEKDIIVVACREYRYEKEQGTKIQYFLKDNEEDCLGTYVYTAKFVNKFLRQEFEEAKLTKNHYVNAKLILTADLLNGLIKVDRIDIVGRSIFDEE